MREQQTNDMQFVPDFILFLFGVFFFLLPENVRVQTCGCVRSGTDIDD